MRQGKFPMRKTANNRSTSSGSRDSALKRARGLSLIASDCLERGCTASLSDWPAAPKRPGLASQAALPRAKRGLPPRLQPVQGLDNYSFSWQPKLCSGCAIFARVRSLTSNSTSSSTADSISWELWTGGQGCVADSACDWLVATSYMQGSGKASCKPS
ncbi:hypothetical protein BJY00DRAFT_199329 [Aspergillus carlsbadensis]|nr:hypothetical protein BJY00DRAFT_199329 [Aspergillus carlsbadensis]